MNVQELYDGLEIELDLFLSVYSLRPIVNNAGGMGINHSFALWQMLRILKPELVVESGIWKGHSTWLIENALPNAKIISFDTDLSKREYISQAVLYIEDDFQYFDWSNINLANSLIFFDDHQNSYFRILLARFFGFKRMIFEDNYSVQDGDFYSLNHIIAETGFTDVQLSKKYRNRLKTILKRLWFVPVLRRIGSSQHLLVQPNPFDAKNLKSQLKDWITFFRIFESDGSISTQIDVLIPNLILPFTAQKIDFSYNNITYVEIK